MDIKRARRIMLRGLRLRCPACGQARLFKSLFKMHEECPHCGMVFMREQGYFIGAIYVNVIVTEGLIFFTYLICLLTLPAANQTVYTILFALALIIPLIFYRHARSIWLSFDYIVDPPKEHSSGGKYFV
ncbi:MAG TPA: DUF983 domain-containing protein [Blastocatellia bacterium]|nr:DUF983 domain-containing protein [Blastocatellia bacterium]